MPDSSEKQTEEEETLVCSSFTHDLDSLPDLNVCITQH